MSQWYITYIHYFNLINLFHLIGYSTRKKKCSPIVQNIPFWTIISPFNTEDVISCYRIGYHAVDYFNIFPFDLDFNTSVNIFPVIFLICRCQYPLHPDHTKFPKKYMMWHVLYILRSNFCLFLTVWDTFLLGKWK